MRLPPGECSEGDSGLLEPVTGVSVDCTMSIGSLVSQGRPCSRCQGPFALSLTTIIAPGVPAYFWRSGSSNAQAAQTKLS